MSSLLKPAVFVACLLPFGGLVFGAAGNSLGPDPAEAIMHASGEWALRLLLLALAVSPVRELLGWRWPLSLRRMLGLYAFFYATLHLVTFSHFYLGWSGAILLEELAERPYIAAGSLAWLLMLPLAVTSTRAMQRKLGRNWRKLHRAVYVAGVFACLHLAWQVRSDLGEPLAYGILLFLLLLWRLRVYSPRRFDVMRRRA
ncbi:sulfoxide reductase heme-binding subunit YedZ [Seongchinamella unica]|uniref:Protein-methionine-sulfoxide reductase heme-binding subunit MsrQ n=1 Tax=Seongchinamella unica TaxID=2547392 RepID=A0A4R5LPN7_9GAMM|nr:protein-methionine-sulfoxide reductase heme-binding subunit MsrQ [Seongchinamella unica]TDG12356.1 sulfoxide reductase heme-binding subunit YedZ [Seongchinamella unica]